MIDYSLSVLKLVNLQLHDKIKLGLAIEQFKQLNNIAMFYSESMCIASQRGNRVLMMKYSEMHNVIVDTVAVKKMATFPFHPAPFRHRFTVHASHTVSIPYIMHVCTISNWAWSFKVQKN